MNLWEGVLDHAVGSALVRHPNVVELRAFAQDAGQPAPPSDSEREVFM